MKKRYVGIFLLVVVCMLSVLSACQSSGSDSTQSATTSTNVTSSNQEVNTPTINWDIIPDSDFEYRYDSELKGVVITKYHGSSNKVRFPDTINGDPVVGLEYLGNSAFVAVYIPNSVLRIGHAAFDNCASLTSITLPDSVTSIGRRAFKDCTGLTSISLPDGLTSIDQEAFSDCGFTSLTIPDSVTSLGMLAFSSCKKLTNIKLPDTSKLEQFVFDNTYWFNSQPDGIMYLGNVLYGYKGNLSENTVVIRDGVTSIADAAFLDCTVLTSVTIPDSVIIIGDTAFVGCINLDEATKSRILQINPKVKF